MKWKNILDISVLVIAVLAAAVLTYHTLRVKSESKSIAAQLAKILDRVLYIKIDKTGNVHLDGAPVSHTELQDKVKELKKTHGEDFFLVLQCDKNTKHGYIAPVTEAIKEAGTNLVILKKGDKLFPLFLPAVTEKKDRKEEPPPMLRIDVFENSQDNNTATYYAIYTAIKGAGQPMEFAALQNYLKIVADNSTETTIVLNCGPYANHDKLIKILDLCSSLGLTNLNLFNADVPFARETAEQK